MILTIGFSKRKKFNLISYIISKIERTDFSHVFLKIKSESLNRNLIYQANLKGVYFIGESLFLKDNEIVYEYNLDINKEQQSKLLQLCIDESGKEYGSLQLIGIGIMRLVKKLFNKTIKNPLSDSDSSYVCVELVAKILNELNLKQIDNIEDIGLSELKDYFS